MKSSLLHLLILGGIFIIVASEKCVLRTYQFGHVCVCNETYCDTINPIAKIDEGRFFSYTSNEDGLRFEKEIGNFTKASNASFSENRITIHTSKLFQNINGFGGALTDSTCINIMSLNEDARAKLMMSYYSEEGIEYNMGRIPMAATDFSLYPYSYHEIEDVELRYFSLTPEDYRLKLPIIRWANNITNHNMRYFVSTWIAPKWMKDNGEYTRGPIKRHLYQVWADYFVKFLDAYKDEGIEFWGITTGNEPNTGLGITRVIPIVSWTSETQKIWLRENLGPTIRNSTHSDIKILIFDDQRLFMPPWLANVFSDEVAYSYADGVALHWYTDPFVSAREISQMHDLYSDKFFIGTESTEGSFTQHPVELGSWKRAEDYATSILEDVNNWVTGWVDWNMVVDTIGGPTYISNFCDAPIIVNASAQEFYKQPMFYTLGHFSKFVPRDSYRIDFSGFSSSVPVTAFKRPDDGIVVVILNKEETSIEAIVEDKNRGNIMLNLTAKSITTIIYW